MTFTAHMIGGSWNVLYGVWWLSLASWANLNAGYWKKVEKRFQHGSGSCCKYKSTPENLSWIPQPFWPKVPMEPIAKILFGLTGIVIETCFDDIPDKDGHYHIILRLYHVFTPDGKLAPELNKFQHSVLYAPYVISGIVDLLSLHITLPPKTSQLFFSATFWIGGMLLLNHRGCNTDLHARMHLFWMATVVACAVFSLLRMIRGSHLLTNMGLASSLLISGTWIIQIAFTLYNPNSHIYQGPHPEGCNATTTTHEEGPDPHWRGLFSSLTFGLHIMGVLVFVLGFWVTIRLLLQKHNYFRRLSRVLPERLQQSWVAVSDSEESLISEQNMEHGSYQKCSVAWDQKDDADTYAV